MPGSNATTPNNTKNVSAGKGVKGGYFFAADATDGNLAALKGDDAKDFSKKVGEFLAGAVNLGYVSEDGWNISDSRSVEEHNDVNGDIVDSSLSSRKETVTAMLLEKKKDTLSELFGSGNVTDADGLITALHTSDEAPSKIYVAELVLKNGRRWRYIIPQGKVTEIGDEKIAAGSLVGREATISCNTYQWDDEHAVTSVDYIESTETARP